MEIWWSFNFTVSFINESRGKFKYTILREEIQNLDQNQISGWIVDVRENEGGNMY